MKRLKVLIVAYACSPKRGSEPGMGWNFVTSIAKHHDVTVIVEKEKFENEINEELDTSPELKETISFYFIKKARQRLLRKIWPPSYYWFYNAWHKKAFKLAKELHNKKGFDLTHQLNMVGYREPGYLWKLGLPFVWGPVGGFNQFPLSFLKAVGIRGGLHYIGRNVLNYLQMHYYSRPRLTAKKADKGMIAATSETQRAIKRSWDTDSNVICEVGSLPCSLSIVNQRKEGQSLQIAWSGLHIHGKALPLLLNGLSQLDSQVDWQLNILGEGPLTRKWKELAGKLEIDNRCKWHGWLQKNNAVGVMKGSHLFVITSLSDLTSTVTLEALSLGLPIICLDHCGFADVVTEECGYKIPVTNPKEVSKNITQKITEVWYNEDKRQDLSRGAMARVNDFNWDKKMEKMNYIYQSVLSNQ
jgi:glycosyltransferase involved in cell wall biosynthesis